MIELIKDVNQCENTCYFEFLPGTFKDKCWNEESVFIYYLQICYIELILAKYIFNYDQYSFMSVDKTTWQDLVKDLNKMKEILRKSKSFNELTSNLTYVFQDVEKNFTEDFEKSRNELMKMIDDFVSWIRETLKNHNKIAILGM